MKLKLLKDYQYKADFTIPKGTEIDVSEKKGKALIAAGIATDKLNNPASKQTEENPKNN